MSNTTGTTSKRRRRLVPTVFLTMFIGATQLVGTSTGASAEVEAGSRPNVVFIFIDDADRSVLGSEAIAQHFPNIRQHLLQDGIQFDNFVTTTPLCGPIRASLFRGQYAHNTGVRTNIAAPVGSGPEVPTGSWSEFYNRGYVDDEIAGWMRGAGYHTMLVGKYHHDNFPGAAPEGTAYVPPGWDEFYASRGVKYYETNRLINGQVQKLLPWPQQYRTDVERDDVVALLDAHENANDGRPFFLYFAPVGPHGQGSSPDPMYASRHAALFQDQIAPRTPSYNEGDTSDKPAHMQDGFAPMATGRKAAVDVRHQDRLRSMLAIDEAIGAIFDQLEASEELEDTVVILASDNGYSMGSHRIPASKKFPYDEIYTIPMLIRGAATSGGTARDHLVTANDIAPTLLALAGVDAPPFVDGRSLLPLLSENPPSPEQWRTAVLVENWSPAGAVDADYRAIRMTDSVYTEWENGDREYYDHSTDPFELENRYDLLTPDEQDELSALLEHHKTCSGPNCNQLIAEPAIASLDASVTTSIDFLPSVSKPGPAPTSGVPPSYRLQGTASARSGVGTVRIVVRNRETGLFWDGTNWQTRYTRVNATVHDQQALFSTWHLDVPSDLTTGDQLTVTARAYGTTLAAVDRSVARLNLEIDAG